MRTLPLAAVVALVVTSTPVHAQGFGTCKPVSQRTSEVGCWILVDQPVGRAQSSALYWHLDRYRTRTAAERAKGAYGVVIEALGRAWVMTIDSTARRAGRASSHVADIGPLHVTVGREYSATLMEAITTPGMTSAVHRHSGPEAWYTVAGETCLETPSGTIVGRAQHPAIVPEGPPMFLTATGTHQRRAITLILHDATRPPTSMEKEWKPRGLCR